MSDPRKTLPKKPASQEPLQDNTRKPKEKKGLSNYASDQSTSTLFNKPDKEKVNTSSSLAKKPIPAKDIQPNNLNTIGSNTQTEPSSTQSSGPTTETAPTQPSTRKLEGVIFSELDQNTLETGDLGVTDFKLGESAIQNRRAPTKFRQATVHKDKNDLPEKLNRKKLAEDSDAESDQNSSDDESFIPKNN